MKTLFNNYKNWSKLIHHKSVNFGNITNGDRLQFAIGLVLPLAIFLIK